MTPPAAPEPSPEAGQPKPAAGHEPTWTVAELSAHLSRLLAAALPGDVWVQGQIRNLKRAATGHVYFDLVEPSAAGDAVVASVSVVLLAAEKRMVNDVLRRTGEAVRMDDGIEVRICGRVRWWAPRGQLQLRMSSIDPAWTLGRLAADRERVLAGLAADGLLDRNRGRPMSAVPLSVGLVTSVGSAAHADFLAELRLGALGFQVFVADARTQGMDCERSVVAALSTLASYNPAIDVIALVRGGGSRTDLAGFDGVGIARAIAAMPVPVLTGIGHETDSSIADAMAYRSFKTPTAAAADLVERVVRFSARVNDLWSSTAALADRALVRAADQLHRRASSVERDTRSCLLRQERLCDDASRRLRRTPVRALVALEQGLNGVEARVQAHDPVRILARGWSITRGDDGQVVRSSAAVSPGQELTTTLTDGTVSSTVSASPDR